MSVETGNYMRTSDALGDPDRHRPGRRPRGERLRIDVVREDVVRVKISRGGEFDETPTYAVCVDPLADVPTSWCAGRRPGTGQHGASTVSCGWTRSGSTCTGPTGPRWSRRRPTRRAATGRTPP